jgi:ribosomal protein L14E/L6E/L27E
MSMEIGLSDIVASINGRDKDKIFFVVGTDGEYVLLADGKGRRVEKPKRKKARHTRFESKSVSRVAEKILSGEKVTNAELRRALSEYGTGRGEEKGGM